MYGYNDMMDGWSGTYNHGDSIISIIFMSIMMILLIVLVVLAVRYFSRYSRVEGEKEDALELLKRRYVSGEINKKQFEQIKKDLKDK